MKITFKALEEAGTKFTIKHYRPLRDGRIVTKSEFYKDAPSANFGDSVLPTGGFTLVSVTTCDGTVLTGKYNFNKAPFVKKKGAFIALQKACFSNKGN